MTLLAGQRVLAVDGAADSALVRFLVSLGAELEPVRLDDLQARLPEARFLVDTLGLDKLADAGWPCPRLSAVNPSLVHVSVSGFGSGGPRARWLGSELVASALGGTLRLTGDPDRAPVKEALDACGFHADMVAAAGAMAAHYYRSRHGQGQHVDVSVQEVAFSRNVNGILVWQFDRRKLGRTGGALNYGRATVRCIWRLSDGWCFHSLMTGRFGAPANQALSDWMDEAGVDNPLRGQDWLRYDRARLDPAVRAAWEAAMAMFFATRTKRDIRIDGRRRGINATVVATPADVLADPHLQAREFWRTDGHLRVPGRFVRLVPGPAARYPAVSDSGGEPRPDAQAPPARGGPLAGVRVLDFSWALVGSICTKTLGDLGAEVIKVESRTRPCLSRLDVQVSASRPDSLDDKPWFAHLNSSKRSVSLNVKHPEARAVLEPLVDWADVVVENFSPGTMAKLGLDWDTLSRRRPDLVMVSGSVFGQTGPLAADWGVDGTGGALSGRTYLTGWPDRDPVIPGAVPYGDVIVPYVMAAAALAALTRRADTGQGCHVDAAMYEICVQQMRNAVLAEQQGAARVRRGNADPAYFHQGVYPAAGQDRWLALSLATAADWQRLRALAGLADAADADGRDALIAGWTASRQDHALMEMLQQAGIAAGVVQDLEDLSDHDPQIAARGALAPLDHPLLGVFGHVRTPITFSATPPRPFRAPGLGEHTREIAGRIARLDLERLAALESAGVFQ